MKLQIMSDLHFEMHADGGAELIRELDPTGVDVLVLAGDITMARHYEDLASVFKPLARKYRHILYVPGNHEYYKSSPSQVARNLAKLTKELPGVVIPENDTVVIAGQRFIAGTMWFRPDPTAEPNKRFMHDFSLIQDFEPWVYEQNAAFEKVLATHLEADDVVITHHLPAFDSVPARFARSAMNAFFVCDMAPQVREHQPRLWIHNAENRALAQATLEDEGFTVRLAASGADALASFTAAPADCVLLDIRMPGMDGIAVCRALRALPGGDDVPILFLTAQRDVDTFDRAREAGGDDFVTKPFRPSELLARVGAATKLRRTAIERRELYDIVRAQRDAASREVTFASTSRVPTAGR